MAFLGLLKVVLGEFPKPEVRAATVVTYLYGRAVAKAGSTKLSTDSRGLNVAVGTEAEMSRWVIWMEERMKQGMVSLGHVPEIVEVRVGLAPLLANTKGHFATGVPVEYETSQKELSGLWEAAHRSLQVQAGVAADDVVMLKWSTHSGRRGGCTCARRLAQTAGIDPARIKEYIYKHFRWSPEEGEMMELYSQLLSRGECLKTTICF